MRILPRINEAVNEEWISDKTRHVVDGLRTQRSTGPISGKRSAPRGAVDEASRRSPPKVELSDGKRIGAVAGDVAAVDEMFALKELLAKFGSAVSAVQGGDAFDPKAGRASTIFNPTISGIEQADAPDRGFQSAPKPPFSTRVSASGSALVSSKIGVISAKAKADLRLRLSRRPGTDSLADLAAGIQLPTVLKNAKNPIVLVGTGAFTRHDGAAVLARQQARGGCRRAQDSTRRIRRIASYRVAVGAHSISALGWRPQCGADDDVWHARRAVPALGADEIKVPDGTFGLYWHPWRRRGAHRADVVLPGAAYAEKSGIYVNTEGRVQMAKPRGVPPGEALRTEAIIRALSDVLGKKLPYDSLQALRQAL